ncbi:tRNA uracil 4-sulfurtransferase ThiI [Atopobacter phocae]|uniref:tRNA uracil 4-sulfurtransferase ThiI n=1 Tax=Atopobacter phocae TaxID=136492 RepID=UPI000470D72D|nr:tRNA uracil 4-sulfurtransferase ThiI [Atopobacter phocae]
MKQYVLVRYGELSNKGKNKKRFTNRLGENVREKLKDLDQTRVVAEHDFLKVYCDSKYMEVVLERLSYVFGIQSYSPVTQVENDMNVIIDTIEKLLSVQSTEGKTFKIITKRSTRNFEHKTNEINRMLGNVVLDRFPNLTVQMKDPDLKIQINIREKHTLISTEIYEGAGGLPVGTSGKGLLMLSGGIDSVVAGYLALKRGIEITAVHFASPPYTSPQALEKTKQLAKLLSRYGSDVPFLTVPFTETQEEIKKHINSGYLMTITRRMMLRVMNELTRQHGGLVIITGESIGQVASQTLESLNAINAVAEYPVLRPLATYDKLEIIKLSEQIGSFDISILPYEDCCTVFAPPSPKTKPRVYLSESAERKIDVSQLVNRAVSGIEIEDYTTNEQVEEELYEDLF